VTRGLLLFAHGARDSNWARPFDAITERVRSAAPSTPVALGFLESHDADPRRAAEQLIGAGCDSVHVVPLFLGAGGHVRKDLPDCWTASR
jgi:sirohydrochlorin cobaltochelatase